MEIYSDVSIAINLIVNSGTISWLYTSILASVGLCVWRRWLNHLVLVTVGGAQR